MSRGEEEGGRIGFWSVVSLGIGGMVGGGIFAVLGLAVQLAGGGAPVAFALAGLVAAVTSVSYARLSVAFPAQGGTVEFLTQAFGTGVPTGALNVLLWLSYIVMLALYAYAFGSYGASFFPASLQGVARHALASGAVLALTLLNALGAGLVGRAEEWIVGAKVAILLLFIAVGARGFQPAAVAPGAWTSPLQLVAGGMIIFLAYEGFELIANSGGDVADPRRTLPRAYYTAVGFVIVLYVAIAAVVVSTLSLAQVVAARDYALAEAARPFLGTAGFTLIGIAALLSTGSAINATLYGAARISYVIAKDGELPQVLERKVWHRPIEGLLVSAGLTLLLANLGDLASISTMGSAGFLLLFAAVNAAAFRLRPRIGGGPGLPIAGVVLCLGALAVLVGQRAIEAPADIWVLVALVGGALLIEATYRWITGRKIRPQLPTDGG